MQDIFLFIQHHQGLSLAFGIVLILILIVEFVRLKRSSNRLTPAQATQLINHQNAVVIDIRNKESFDSGHIVDALSMPQSTLNDSQKKLEKFKSKPIVLVCNMGTEADRAAIQLAKSGFNVFILAGGIRGWRMAELPLVKG